MSENCVVSGRPCWAGLSVFGEDVSSPERLVGVLRAAASRAGVRLLSPGVVDVPAVAASAVLMSAVLVSDRISDVGLAAVEDRSLWSLLLLAAGSGEFPDPVVHADCGMWESDGWRVERLACLVSFWGADVEPVLQRVSALLSHGGRRARGLAGLVDVWLEHVAPCPVPNS